MADYSHINAEGTLLRKHQLRMLEMLIYFDSVCKANGIKYWLSSGTLLGAVRHGGFIPWDDDLDVEMLHNDYKKISKILSKDDKYYFQTHKSDPYYAAPYAKLRDKHSIIEEHGQDAKYRYKGIYIDIFIMENNHKFLAYFFEKLMWQVLIIGSKSRSKINYVCFSLLKRLMYLSINVISPISTLFRNKKLRHTYGSGFVKYTRDLDKILPLAEVLFEEHMFPAPRDTNFYLSSLYGDYMKLPDVSKVQAHTKNIKFID